MGIFIPAKFHPVAHLRHPGFNGKDSAPAPDYAPVAAASVESAKLGAELGHEQLAENRRQYDESKAGLKPILDAQLGIMKDSQKAAAEDRAYTMDTFRPLETGLVKDAQDFSEAGAQEGFTRSAVADTERAQANEEAQSNRAMTSMGVNPNSGRFAGMKRGMGLMSAAQRAGVATTARIQGNQLATAKKMEAAGLGRNLAATTQGSNQVALQGAGGATTSTMAPGQQLLNGMSAGNGTIMQGQGMKMQGLGNVLNAQTSYANANQGDSVASLLATGIGAYAGLKS